MRRILDQSAVLKQMDTVADKLAVPALKPKARLALLRRQAQLGDLRDAIALRDRRANR
ncbi:MAG: hypothetical protein QOG68_288 [Solirubrobacteraceae bacterium]|jgi:hypothetical protein|nr:hypothetical protein [Solirubrobacteraceae bacterium]